MAPHASADIKNVADTILYRILNSFLCHLQN